MLLLPQHHQTGYHVTLASVLQVIFGSGAYSTPRHAPPSPHRDRFAWFESVLDTGKGIASSEIYAISSAASHRLPTTRWLWARRRIENTRTHHFVGNSEKGRKAQDHIGVLCNVRIGKNSLHLAVCNHGNTICIVDNRHEEPAYLP